MSGAILSLPSTPSWRGARLKKKHRDNFSFTRMYSDVLRPTAITDIEN
jgi:hypothetical protein